MFKRIFYFAAFLPGFCILAYGSVVLQLDAPLNLIAVPGNKQITLTWSASNSKNVIRYRVYRATASPASTLIDSVNAGTTIYTDTELTNGTTYFYLVTAVDSSLNQSEFSNEAVATPQPKAGGNALSLDGDEDYVNLGMDSFLPNTYTLEAWVYHEAGSSLQPIVSKDGRALGGDWSIHWSITSGNHQRLHQQNNAEVVDSKIVPANRWTHVAVVFDGSSVRFYTNSVLGLSFNCLPSTVNNQPWIIGGNPNPTEWYAGRIDEVRIWNKARSQAEIHATMKTTLTGNEPGLVGYWRLDESVGSPKTYDSSPNGNHGILYGNATFGLGFEPPPDKPPVVGIVSTSPRYVIPGDSVQITAYIFDEESDVDSVSVEIESPDENVMATLTLYDDGSHNDGDFGDNIFGNYWTAIVEKDYFLDIFAVDSDTNSATYDNVARFTVTLIKPTFNIYFGNLHSHTSYSDGVGTPAEAFEYARDVAKIDFLALTDHHNQLSDSEYVDILSQASAYTQDGDFVAIAGQEWTGANHLNVFEADHVFTAQEWDFTAFYEELARSGCTAQLNHPGYGSLNNFAYSFLADMGINSIEVRWDEEQNRYVRMLNNGWHVGVDGSQDNHDWTWGDGPYWTAVLAPSLTKFDILDAIRNHRTYSTLDRDFQLMFRVNNYWIGESFDHVDNITFTVRINDPDSQDDTEFIELYQDGMVVSSIQIDESSYNWNPVITPPIGEHNYFVKVYQKDGDKIWSSPIWINSTTNLPSTPIVSSPKNNDILFTSTPIFVWHPSNNANSYTLQYSTSIEFPNDPSTVTITDINDTLYALSDNLEENTFYYWRVSASNNYGNSTYSVISRFSIDSDALFSTDSEIRLTTDLSEDIRPSIIEASEGKILLVWCSMRNNNWDIYYKTSSDNGKHWSEDFRLTADENRDLNPAITEDSEGKIWVTWYSDRDGNYEIYYKTFDGTSWSKEINLTQHRGKDYGPSITQTSDGLIWIVWNSDREDGNQELYYKTFDGSTWSPETRLTFNEQNDHYPDLIQVENGDLWLVWTWSNYDDWNDEIFYKVFDGNSWSEETNLTNTPTPEYELYPSVTQTSGGQIWLTYTKWSENVSYRIFENGSWSEESMLPRGSIPNQWSSVTQTSDGRVWIAYHSTRNGNTDIYAQRSNYPLPTSVEIANTPMTPNKFKLDQNYPNPFNPETNIRFALPSESHVKIVIYNILGQKVKTLVDKKMNAGYHIVRWDSRDDIDNKVGSGIYFYTIKAKEFSQTKKMIIFK